jgi:hypothetical protein
MYITPNSIVKFIKNCPLTNYDESIYFNSANDQYEYFNNLAKKSNLVFENVSFIREEPGIIRVNSPLEPLHDVTYMMYKNVDFEDMWFYAFVRKVDYLANNSTSVYFEIDDLQTWFIQQGNAQMLMRECFVEREHSATDEIGKNIVEENLGFGDRVFAPIQEWGSDIPVDEKIIPYTDGARVAICATLNFNKVTAESGFGSDPDKDNPFKSGGYKIPTENISGFRYNNYFSGCKYYILLKAGDIVDYDGEQYTVTKADEALAEALINEVVKDGHSENIISMYMVNGGGLKWTAINNNMVFTETDVDVIEDKYRVGFPRTIGIAALDFDTPVVSIDREVSFKYQPHIVGSEYKNNKLFTYPYSYLYLTDQNGSELIIKPEFLYNGLYDQEQKVYVDDSGKLCFYKLKYNVMSTMQIPSSSRVVFPQYKGSLVNYANGIDIGPFPMCSWQSGTYSRWLAQNSAPMVAGAFSSLMNLGSGYAPELNEKELYANRFAQTYNDNGDVLRKLTPIGYKLAPTKNAVSAAGSAISGVATNTWSSLASMASASHLPEKANGVVGNSNIFFDNDLQKCYLRFVTLNLSDSKIIDNFFTKYGYACKQVKQPNISSRPRWNYVKTLGCQILGNIPIDVKRKICAIFDAGILFWKYREDMDIGNYYLDNKPIGGN